MPEPSDLRAPSSADPVPAGTDPANVVAPADSRLLPSAAQRALAEAKARRAALDAATAALPTEEGGRGGLDPVRYGDWEIKGLTADF